MRIEWDGVYEIRISIILYCIIKMFLIIILFYLIWEKNLILFEIKLFLFEFLEKVLFFFFNEE